MCTISHITPHGRRETVEWSDEYPTEARTFGLIELELAPSTYVPTFASPITVRACAGHLGENKKHVVAYIGEMSGRSALEIGLGILLYPGTGRVFVEIELLRM